MIHTPYESWALPLVALGQKTIKTACGQRIVLRDVSNEPAAVGCRACVRTRYVGLRDALWAMQTLYDAITSPQPGTPGINPDDIARLLTTLNDERRAWFQRHNRLQASDHADARLHDENARITDDWYEEAT